MSSDRLLTGITLLHPHPARVEVADIRIRDGRIAEVGPGLTPAPGELVEDLGGKWVIPGLVVGHHHLYSALAGGMPLPSEAPVDFADMLAKVWWKLDKALDEEGVEVSGLVGGTLALRAGVTTIVDHHASPGFIRGSLETLDRSLGTLGLRRVLCYEITDRGGPEEARAGLEAHVPLLEAGPDGWRAVMVGGHANFTMSDATLRAAADLARAHGAGLHIHVAEAEGDRRLVGEPLIDRMARLGALVPGSLFCHCVHLAPEEIRRVADAGVWISHQPRSNMNNGVGYAPVGAFPAHTVLGTDGIGADMLAEVQAGYFRAREGDVPWWPDRFVQALYAAAEFAGDKLGVTIGRLEPGAEADLAVLDPNPGPPLSGSNLPGAFIFRFSSQMVRHVMVGGQWRLRDRVISALDEAALDERARRVAVETWDRMRAQ